jgi:sugar-specific transcriptional regulator TrmB
MENSLIAAGLSEAQAQVYLYLLTSGTSSPPACAKGVGMTRTNAYKVLDTLEEMGLALKSEHRGKIIYSPANPSALTELVAEKRNQIIALEKNVKIAMNDLQRKYYKNAGLSDISIVEGTEAMVALYEAQATQSNAIYFIKSRADIPFFGFETLDRLRKLPAEHGALRFGITADVPEASRNPSIDARTNLTRTWMNRESYESPVEWTVAGDELLIHIFEGDGRSICIKDSTVASAFTEVWKLLDVSLRSNPSYGSSRAQRDI